MRVLIPLESAAVRLMPHCSIMASFNWRAALRVDAPIFSFGSP